MSEPSLDFLLHLNEPNFKIPLELYKKNLKDINRINEKQFTLVGTNIFHVEQATALDDKLGSLDELISSLESYQGKLEDKIDVESDYSERLNKRIDKFTQLNEFRCGNFSYGMQYNKKNFLVNKVPNIQQTNRKLDNATEGSLASNININNNTHLNNWYKDQINTLVAHYLIKVSDFSDLPQNFFKKPINFKSLDKNSEVVSNYIKSKPALLYLHNFNNAELIDYELHIKSNLVTQDTLFNKCDNSLLGTWIKENDRFLKKIQSNLKFELLISNFVERIKGSVLKNERNIDLSNFSYHSNQESNYLDALLYMKQEILPLNNEEHNKYIDEIKTAMGLLTMPNKFILLFLKYEKFLIKNFYKKRYSLNNLSSSFYSEKQYTNFRMLVTKELLIKFLNQFPGSKQLKLTYKKYLFDKNITKYYKLLSFKRFNYLNDIYIKSHDQLYNINSNGSAFELLMSLGISVLKTRNCITPKDLKKVQHLSNFDSLNLNVDHDHSEKLNRKLSKNYKHTKNGSTIKERLIKIKSKNCAICSSIQLIKLSNQLVFSHHSKSKLNYKTPIILPNDNIYDKNDLFQFNEALVVTFKAYLDDEKNSRQIAAEEENHEVLHLDLVNDYSNYFHSFKEFVKEKGQNIAYQSNLLEAFDKVVDPLTGEFFTKDQCNVKVFPT